MANERLSTGITLPHKLIKKLDTLRDHRSQSPEFAGRDRSATIEILIVKGLKVLNDGEN